MPKQLRPCMGMQAHQPELDSSSQWSAMCRRIWICKPLATGSSCADRWRSCFGRRVVLGRLAVQYSMRFMAQGPCGPIHLQPPPDLLSET